MNYPYPDIWNVAAGQFEPFALWKLHCCDYVFPKPMRECIDAELTIEMLANKAARRIATALLNKADM